jgi:hypothetical protein
MNMGAPSQRLEPEARDPRRFAPIFLLATQRSYSSVVTAMIGQHAALADLPELKLFAFPTIGEMEASLPRYWMERGITHRSPGLIRALAQFLFDDQDSHALVAARAWLALRSHWAGEDVLDLLLEQLRPLIAIEKSPENAASDDALARLSAAYPRARYIHLTRHPATTQRSLQAHWERIVPNYPLEGQPMLGFAAWVDTNRRILNFTAGLPADRILRLRAEDVLHPRSAAALGRVTTWLGLDSRPPAIDAMRHPEFSPFAYATAKGTGLLGGLDGGFLVDTALRPVEPPPALGRPEGWSGHEPLWQSVIDLAVELGYPCQSA